MSVKNFMLLIFLVSFSVAAGEAIEVPRLYIWNVGQGQWLTWVRGRECDHFDMGGEWAPLKKIRALCGFGRNRLFLSHADLDHIRYIPWATTQLPQLCLHALPREKLNTLKSRILAKIDLCKRQVFAKPGLSHAKSPTQFIEEITVGLAGGVINNFKQVHANDLSRVYVGTSATRMVLVPGDSTIPAELLWSDNLGHSSRANISVLILGHHGSKTSTGEKILSSLPNLRLTVSSARKKRYGHPHPLVLQRVRDNGFSHVGTEVWGDIIIEMK